MKKAVGLFFFLAFVSQVKASELFIRIRGGGTYEITVGDQLQRNSKGNFRFFDVDPGLVRIKIKEGNAVIEVYDGKVNVFSNKRLVMEYTDGKLNEVMTTRMSTDCDFPAAYNHHTSNGTGACDENSFSEMLTMLKDQGMDSKILEKAKVYTVKANFTSSQVKRICELFTYDSNRLEYAKYAYDYVVDRGSYFVVEKAFTYNSNKEELEKFISTR